MTLKVSTLSQAAPIADENGNPTAYFLQNFNGIIANIVSSINDIEAAQAAAAAAQTAADTAQSAADTAQTAASTAQTAADSASTAASAAQATADAVKTTTALQFSYVTGCTITGHDAGTDATVTISDHTRHYGDGTSVAVTGGSITGLPYSTAYYIYYDDPGFAGGAVTYQATTDATTAAQTGSRHMVGAITTPAASAADTTGLPVLPPGAYAVQLPF